MKYPYEIEVILFQIHTSNPRQFNTGQSKGQSNPLAGSKKTWSAIFRVTIRYDYFQEE
ncbi:MAG: hypothetical protein R3E39_20630 [Anaerolineae bacterium]